VNIAGFLVVLLSIAGPIVVLAVLYFVIKGAVLAALRQHDAERRAASASTTSSRPE